MSSSRFRRRTENEALAWLIGKRIVDQLDARHAIGNTKVKIPDLKSELVAFK